MSLNQVMDNRGCSGGTDGIIAFGMSDLSQNEFTNDMVNPMEDNSLIIIAQKGRNILSTGRDDSRSVSPIENGPSNNSEQRI